MALYLDKEFLHEKYINHKWSVRQIARLCEVSHMTIFRMLKKYNIPLRSQEEGLILRRKKLHGYDPNTGTGGMRYKYKPHEYAELKKAGKVW